MTWERMLRTDDCWLWTGPLDRYGYGLIKVDGRTKGIHRWVYEQLVGPILEGLQLDHLCRVRNCVRPEHLEPVTVRTNVLRGAGVTARNAAATHCIHGHEFTPANTHTYTYRGQVWRKCRACHRLRAAESRRRRAA